MKTVWEGEHLVIMTRPTDDMPTLAVLAGEYKTAQNALDNMEETS